MKIRQAATLLLALSVLGACKKRTPAAAPDPAADSAAVAAREQARADSIAAADAERVRRAPLAESGVGAAEEARLAANTLTETVLFEYDSNELSAEAEEKLRAKAEILRANPGLQIQIEGHADARGSTEYNLALGQRRAETVRAFLTGYGIEEGRISTLSYGEEQPRVTGDEEDAYAQNRRAEFSVLSGEVVNVPSRGR